MKKAPESILRKFAFLSLVALFWAAGCIGNPGDLHFCDDCPADAGDDVGDLPDINPALDTGADADEDVDTEADTDTDIGIPPCIVPTEYADLHDAFDAGCQEILIPGGQVAALKDTALSPLRIERDLRIYGEGSTVEEGGVVSSINAPLTGLFVVSAGAELTLEELDITSTDLGFHQTAPIVVEAASTLSAQGVMITNLLIENGSAIEVSQNSSVALSNTTISGVNSYGENPAGIHCTDSEIVLSQDSKIAANQIQFNAPSLDENLEIRGAGVFLQGCSFTLDNSSLSENEIVVTIADININLAEEFNVKIGGAGLTAIESTVVINDEASVAGNKINIAGNNAGLPVQLAINICGAGLELENSELLIDEARVAVNEIFVEFTGNLVEGPGTQFSARGAGVCLHGNQGGNPLISNSTISNNSIAYHDNVSAKRSGYGAGLSFEGWSISDQTSPQLQMVNTTISGNSIGNAERTFGAGLFIDGNHEDEHYIALLRYLTIASNTIALASSSVDREGAAGLYVQRRGADLSILPFNPIESSTGAEDAPGARISMIGVLMADNLRDGDHSDCGGSATVSRILPVSYGGDLATTTGSAYNFTGGPEVSAEQCQFWLEPGEDGDDESYIAVARIPISLGQLADNGGPTSTHLPNVGELQWFYMQENISVLINLIQSECSGINSILTRDQRGHPRPVDNFTGQFEFEIPCVVGAVEIQPDEMPIANN